MRHIVFSGNIGQRRPEDRNSINLALETPEHRFNIVFSSNLFYWCQSQVPTMAHITPLAFHFTDPTPTNIKDITFGCCDFFKANSPSKWLAEEYIKVDSTFDTYLTTLGRLGKKKSQTAVFCYQLLQHYLSSSGQEQLKLLMQQKSTFLSKEIAKSSTHQAVYNEIHSDNDRKRQLEDVESQSSFDSSQLYSPTHSSVPDSPPPSRRLRRGDTIGPGQSSGSTAGVMHDLLSSDPADDSFVHVDEVHEPEGKMFTYDFLDGDGRYDSNVEEQWIYSNIEIGKALLAFRSRVVGNNFGISQPHEKLALNFIFLIESEFQTGGLQGEVDDDVWVALWESVGELNMPIFASEEIVDAHMWAHLAATCGYDKFIQTLEDSPPASKLLKQVLTRLTITRELWAQEEENEATFLKNMLEPCLDACFGTMLHTNTKWVTSLNETRDTRSRLLIPDYSVSTLVGSQPYSVVHLERKTSRNGGSSQIWDDLTKLGQELKFSLDAMIKLQPHQSVCSQGILVQGSQLEFYHMTLESEGIYLMRRYAKCFLCTGSDNMFPLVRVLEVMRGTKEMASFTVNSMRQVKINPSPTPLVPLSWIRPSYNKPRRVEIRN